MGTGRKKIAMKKIPSLKNRRVTLTKRRQGLFKKLDKLQTDEYRDLGCVVAAVVFSSAGTPFTHGDMSLLDLFEEANSEVWDGGEVEQLEIIDCDLKLGMNWDGENEDEAMRLGLEDLKSAVDECEDYESLKGLKKRLQRFKENKFAVAYGDFLSRKESSQPVSKRTKIFGYIDRTIVDSLEKKLKEITILCDVDAFFICAAKGTDGVPSDFHIFPNDVSMVRRLIRQYVLYGINKSRKNQVKFKTMVSEESYNSVLTKVELMGKIDSLKELVDEKLKLLMDCQLLTEFHDSFKPGLFELLTAPKDAILDHSSDSFDRVYGGLG